MYDLVYHGQIYDVYGLRKATIIIEAGRIVKIKQLDTSVKGEVTINYLGNPNVIAFPGFIDMHVHLRDFKQSYKETIDTGTLAAAKGGITVVGDMPNTIPRLDTLDTIEKRKEIYEEKSHVDYYVYSAIPRNREEIDVILSMKLVMGIKLYPQDYSHPNLLASLKSLKKKGKILVVHPEEKIMYREALDLVETLYVRPVNAEHWAVMHLGDIIGYNNVKVHITHVTSPETLFLSKRYGFTVDTCPHYVLFDIEHVFLKGCLAKVYPPIRNMYDRIRLWSLLRNGYIDAVSSDHAPHGNTEKYCCPSTCPGGINGVEITVPFLGHLVSLGEISIREMYRYLAYNPARILGLNKYGVFCKDCRGNMTIVDFSGKTVIEPEASPSKTNYSIYEGFVFFSKVLATIVGGKPVYLDNRLEPMVRGVSVGEFENK